MHSASVRLSIVAIVICFGVAGTLTAQVPRGSEFARAQQTSNAAMRGYSWKSRTELKLKGETKKVTPRQVRFDFDQEAANAASSDNCSWNCSMRLATTCCLSGPPRRPRPAG